MISFLLWSIRGRIKGDWLSLVVLSILDACMEKSSVFVDVYIRCTIFIGFGELL